MSWKCSIRHWSIGRYTGWAIPRIGQPVVGVHVYVHALDPLHRKIVEIFVGRRSIRLWPWFDPDARFLRGS